MSCGVDQATRLAMMISDAMNIAAFVLLAPESAQGTMSEPGERGEQLRTTLERLVTVLDELSPEDLARPAKFDWRALRQGASELLSRLEPWDHVSPAPPQVMAAFAEMMTAMGLTEEQFGAMVENAGATPND